MEYGDFYVRKVELEIYFCDIYPINWVGLLNYTDREFLQQQTGLCLLRKAGTWWYQSGRFYAA